MPAPGRRPQRRAAALSSSGVRRRFAAASWMAYSTVSRGQAVSPKSFKLRSQADDSIAFQGRLSPPEADHDSGDQVRIADFSHFNRTGRYYLEVEGIGRSWTFSIDPQGYRRAYYLAMRSYYGQRCGTSVDLGPEFPGYRHAPCHLLGAFHESSGRAGVHPSTQGWHDAGDYGRYVVNSGISTGTLLLTWELFQNRIRRISLNLPESGNGTPDILNEIHWNLEWMLTMQDSDGGVWHKQTSTKFSGFVMPEKDTLVSLRHRNRQTTLQEFVCNR